MMKGLGLNQHRLQLAWINASEGEQFASKIKEMQAIANKTRKEEIERSMALLKRKQNDN